jgi:N-acetyl-anhydromuramyl-L-alanine amidase AmpD
METILTTNKSSRNNNAVEGIIIHFTAAGDIDGTIKWFKDPQSAASAHYVISRTGRIVQMVNEEDASWHAGGRTTNPTFNGKNNLNLWTIGIELCNWGYFLKASKDEDIPYTDPVTKKTTMRHRVKDQLYTYFYNWTFPYTGPAEEHSVQNPIPAMGSQYWNCGGFVQWWEPYPQQQIDALVSLLKYIIERYPNINAHWITGHESVDPTRKLDPGPLFPWELIQNSTTPTIIMSNKGDAPQAVSYAEMLLNADTERSC